MERQNDRICLALLREELIPAAGCTEPIAVAYCGALARKALGCLPEQVEVAVSGNILKNVMSVIVPNTGGSKGIPAAAAAGIVAGDSDKKLEVISDIAPAAQEAIHTFLETVPIHIAALPQGDVLDILITVQGGGHTARARITHTHTNVTRIERDGQTLYAAPQDEPGGGTVPKTESPLTVEGIYDFACHGPLSEIRPIIERQIACNQAIAEEGIRGGCGANIGRIILQTFGGDIRQRARAMAAAGSDARMSGCELPVVVNSGSGNQGITVCLPVLEYGKYLGCSEEQILRALALSNLIAIHQKKGLGCLSAYCGAVSAGAAAGCGIAYLHGGDLDTINHTLVNALAIASGIVCDGAKPSCAAKIASAVDAGILGFEMYRCGQQFYGGDGIVSKGVENTIHNICRLGAEGMRETDQEIIRMMVSS